jgi:hypothetical protein
MTPGSEVIIPASLRSMQLRIQYYRVICLVGSKEYSSTYFQCALICQLDRIDIMMASCGRTLMLNQVVILLCKGLDELQDFG